MVSLTAAIGRAIIGLLKDILDLKQSDWTATPADIPERCYLYFSFGSKKTSDAVQSFQMLHFAMGNNEL